MSIPNILNTGRSGMTAAKAGIATSGHNISNANTEGFSRQRVHTDSVVNVGGHLNQNSVGAGTQISRVERVNDEYLEKQIRNSNKELAHFEEKDLALKQVEDIFNEMNGDGLNRVVSRFFNEFRKLTNDPQSAAVRESVREATRAMINDFHRLSKQLKEVGHHIDSRIEGYVSEVNTLATELGGLNYKVKEFETRGSVPNDLLDQRDTVLKKLGSFFDFSAHKDEKGNYNVEIKNGGMLVSGSGEVQKLSGVRTSADEEGKAENSLDIVSTGTIVGTITHQIRGGKLGALLEVRDEILRSAGDRLDELAYQMTQSINEVHQAGLTQTGLAQISLFRPLDTPEGAAEDIALSDEVQASSANIVAGFDFDSPGDNRVAQLIAGLQNVKPFNNGNATFDDFYNSIVSDVGVMAGKNRFILNQHKDIVAQLNKVREQISGVSIDEETTNLLQFQHVFDASAKVIQVADEMLKTVLSLKRD